MKITAAGRIAGYMKAKKDGITEPEAYTQPEPIPSRPMVRKSWYANPCGTYITTAPTPQMTPANREPDDRVRAPRADVLRAGVDALERAPLEKPA